jgi:hypothetical protein
MEWKKYQAMQAYNKFLADQKQSRGRASCSVSTFYQIGNTYPLSQAGELTSRNYPCRGNTPLYDTIAYTIRHIEQTQNNPNDVVIIIITDGEENASQEFRNPVVLADLITKKHADGWQFIYCSCSYHPYRDGERIGIRRECISDFNDLPKIFHDVSSLLLQYRSGEIKQITFQK